MSVYKHIGESLGDPHIITMDGLHYSFNGLGEYWLMKGIDFNLQGRTAVIEDNGAPLEATYFSGFVIKQITPESDTVQLQLNDAKSGLGKCG